ncbi:DUF2530 domain-containing protein [Nocardioides yefusunii]|uniref:DUF2530 domain-containing protein n=1 Tax=Nocardioides yefusunii TaxID=2500546 RepID=A0ABW1QXI5_9ACTN|nr:DUF2530 domain-containing protein [Nocardioides yefusunii]
MDLYESNDTSSLPRVESRPSPGTLSITLPPAVVEIQPLDADGVRTAEVGTALWGIALLGMLPFYSTLQASGRVWWIWVCSAGLGMGLLGIEYCRRRRDANRNAEVAEQTHSVTGGGRRRAA